MDSTSSSIMLYEILILVRRKMPMRRKDAIRRRSIRIQRHSNSNALDINQMRSIPSIDYTTTTERRKNVGLVVN